MKKTISRLVIPITFLFGLLIRLMHIGSADLWRDEAFSVRAAMFDFPGMITAIGKDTAPPLHTIVLHFWIKLFGHGDLSVRMPSLIFGTLAMYIFYLILKTAFKNRALIVPALLLFAFNPVLVWYSQEARAYAMMLFFSLSSMYFVIRIIQSKDQSRKNEFINLFGLGTSTLFGLYTHNLFIFVAFVNLLLILYYKHKSELLRLKLSKTLMKILGVYFVAGLLYLPWFIITLHQLKTVNEGGFWLHFDPLLDLVATTGQFFTAENRPDLEHMTINIIMTPLWIIGGGAFLFSIYLFVRRKLSKELQIIFLWLFASTLLIWLYSFKTSFFYIRYLIFLVPAVLILTINSLGMLHDDNYKSQGRSILNYMFILLVTVLILNSFILTYRQNLNLKASKADTISLVNDVDYKEGDLILHTHAYTHHAFNVYSTLPNKIYNPDDNLPYYEGLAVIRESDYYKQKEINGYRRVWVIYLWGPRSELEQELVKHYHLEYTKDYNGNNHMQLWVHN